MSTKEHRRLSGAGVPSGEGRAGAPRPASGYLVPAAVVLRGGAVVLQDFGDCALVDALEVQLPLPKFQETPGNRETSPFKLLPRRRSYVERTTAFLRLHLLSGSQHDRINRIAN